MAASALPLADIPQAFYEFSGAALLAQQPSEPAKPKAADTRPQWLDMQSHLEARLGNLRNWRNSWLMHWQLIANYLLPRRNLWLIEGAGNQPVPNSMIRGNPINQNIIDGTGTLALRVCAAGMMSGLTSPTRPWFRLKPALPSVARNLDRDSTLWLEDVQDRMYQVMQGSNFYDALAQMYEDISAYGTAPVLVYEDVEDIIRLYNPVAGEYMLAVSNAFRVESFYRQFVMTTSQIVEMFGIENCPPDVQGMWRDKGSSLETERIVAHAIEPNFPIRDRATGEEGMLLRADFPWREVYWMWGFAANSPLSLRGFHEPPHVAPRWGIAANDAYGRSPGMDALPDIMQLQLETKRKAEAIEKMVRPPLLASMDLKNEPSSILPGHVTYVTQLGPDKGMRPIYTVPPEIQHMVADINQIQERIQKAFYNDLFMMFNSIDTVRTATEIDARREEKLVQLGPVVERLQNEALSPIIRRVYAIMDRKKLLPPMPDSMRGVPLQIDYISMLAVAQRAAATAGIERTLSVIGNMAAVYPEARFLIDPMEAGREYGSLLNTPSRIFRPPEEVDQMVADAQKQQQAQQAVQMGMQGAQVVPDAARNLSETKLGGGQSALDMMLGLGSPTAGSA